jgi:hypothetical protein
LSVHVFPLFSLSKLVYYGFVLRPSLLVDTTRWADDDAFSAEDSASNTDAYQVCTSVWGVASAHAKDTR